MEETDTQAGETAAPKDHLKARVLNYMLKTNSKEVPNTKAILENLKQIESDKELEHLLISQAQWLDMSFYHLLERAKDSGFQEAKLYNLALRAQKNMESTLKTLKKLKNEAPEKNEIKNSSERTTSWAYVQDERIKARRADFCGETQLD